MGWTVEFESADRTLSRRTVPGDNSAPPSDTATYGLARRFSGFDTAGTPPRPCGKCESSRGSLHAAEPSNAPAGNRHFPARGRTWTAAEAAASRNALTQRPLIDEQQQFSRYSTMRRVDLPWVREPQTSRRHKIFVSGSETGSSVSTWAGAAGNASARRQSPLANSAAASPVAPPAQLAPASPVAYGDHRIAAVDFNVPSTRQHLACLIAPRFLRHRRPQRAGTRDGIGQPSISICRHLQRRDAS